MNNDLWTLYCSNPMPGKPGVNDGLTINKSVNFFLDKRGLYRYYTINGEGFYGNQGNTAKSGTKKTC